MPKKKDLPEFCYCLGGCGEKILINTAGRRQTFIKKGGIYCRDCVAEINRKRLIENNPMDSEIGYSNMMKKRKGPTILGGNGRGYTQAQKLLWKKLGRGWWAEFIVPTHQKNGLPTHYKIDLANCYYGIAIELDGGSHRGKIAQEEDNRKNLFLESKGWKVLRFRNKEVLKNIDLVMEEIMSTISKSKETIIILPMEY